MTFVSTKRIGAIISAIAVAMAPVHGFATSMESQNHKACASLWVYDNTKCIGSPKRSLSFPVSTEPGSACYFDVSMECSVSDQYCNLETGNYHQLLFPPGGECDDVPFPWSLLYPINQTFTTDNCIGGYSLRSCKKGKCRYDDQDEVDSDSDVVDSFVLQNGVED